MKKIITVFSRRVFYSDATGAPDPVGCAEALIPVLGGAAGLRVEVTVYNRSGATAQGEMKLYEGTKSDVRPSATNGGVQLGSTTTLSALGVSNVQVAGPFNGRVEFTFAAKASDAPSSQVWVEAEVAVTAEYP